MNGWMGSEGNGSPGMMVPMVPLPLMMVGVIFAFMCGAMFGMMMGRKREMMMQGGWQGGGWHGGKPWMQHGMRAHHHHGEGAPACREWHGEWPKPETAPLDD